MLLMGGSPAPRRTVDGALLSPARAFLGAVPGYSRLDQVRRTGKQNTCGSAQGRRRGFSEDFPHTAATENSFTHHDKLFRETGRETSRNSAQRRRSQSSTKTAPLLLQLPALSAGHLNPLGDVSMSKRIALFSAAAFAALALTAAVVAPVSAQDKMKSEMSGEKTVMVGGAAMFPSKNIIQNAVNSKDHTTLVAAVKAAGLVETLEGKGPFTVFAPTNTAFGKLPAGTVDSLVKPENKATLTKILTYHVVPGKLEASSLTDGKKLKTVEGEELTVKHQDGKVWIVDAKGDSSMVTITNVNQSNGVIHVVDTVLMPAS
jgi:uncharacterized surface protein with fasciclin (FAS1) repeats